MPTTTSLHIAASSTDHLNPKTTAMSPSTRLLSRAKEEELNRLYKDPNKYRKNSKGKVLFWINFILMLVKQHMYNSAYIYT